MNKEISIIIPTFNREKYIKKCLSSVNTTDDRVEVIVVDDGSTDKTVNIVQEYINKNKNIHYFYEKNSGVSVARNTGIKKASGKYIFFLDSDDFLTVDGISLLLSYVDTNKDIIIFPYLTIKLDYNFKGNKGSGQSKLINDKSKVIKAAFTAQNVVKNFINQDMRSSCAKLIKKDIILQNNLRFNKNIDIAEDLIFMLRIYNSANTFLYVDRVVYFYVMHKASSINSYHPEFLKNIIVINKNIDNSIQTKSLSIRQSYNYYKLNNLFLYLKYDIFNKNNQESRKEKYKKIDKFINGFNYKSIYLSVKKSPYYKTISISKRLFYIFTIHRLFLLDEIIFYIYNI